MPEPNEEMEITKVKAEEGRDLVQQRTAKIALDIRTKKSMQ